MNKCFLHPPVLSFSRKTQKTARLRHFFGIRLCRSWAVFCVFLENDKTVLRQIFVQGFGKKLVRYNLHCTWPLSTWHHLQKILKLCTCAVPFWFCAVSLGKLCSWKLSKSIYIWSLRQKDQQNKCFNLEKTFCAGVTRDVKVIKLQNAAVQLRFLSSMQICSQKQFVYLLA